MFSVKAKVFWSVILILIFSACGTTGGVSSTNSGASPSDAMAAAQAALDRMDGKPATSGGGSTSGNQQPQNANPFPAQSAPPVAVNNSRTQPKWVDSVDSVYNRSIYVAAVGHASNRAMAEGNAFTALAAIFGQSIKADTKITNTYKEVVKSGGTAGWTDSLEMQNVINTSVNMDLVGAEIKEVWFDSRSTYYAVAVMEKAKAAQMYTAMINANQNMINNLLTMSSAEKNSIEGFTRYQFAAAVADMNTSFVNLLRLIDAQPPSGLKAGNDYRLEAQNIAKAIPVGIAVKNDKAGRIQGAFAKSLADLGFRSGGNNSRYLLQVDITVSPVDLPNNANKFARIEMTANFTDTTTRSVLFPYNYNGREGHTSMSEAENRVYMVTERKINEEYTDVLSEYLSQILPKR